MKDWSQTYSAQVLEIEAPWGPARHLIIRRHDDRSTLISWEVLQQIKNEMLGSDVRAIEIFPIAGEVINEANRRHLWEVPWTVMLPSL